MFFENVNTLTEIEKKNMHTTFPKSLYMTSLSFPFVFVCAVLFCICVGSPIQRMLIYKYERWCSLMTGMCPLCCMHTTASYKLFFSGVNSKPRSSLTLWFENLYGFAIGLPSSSHLFAQAREIAASKRLMANTKLADRSSRSWRI